MVQGLTKRETEITDIAIIEELLAKEKIMHIGLVDNDEPYVLPMNYGYILEEGKLTFYLHGSTKGRKLDIIRKNPKISFSIETDIEAFEGEVACQYGTSYAAIYGKGVAEILESPEDKIKGLSLFMKSQTGKDFEFNEKLVSIVSVIKINVTQFTAKQRPKPIGMK